MGGGKKQIVGYQYFIGLHMAFCHGPVDSVSEILVADKKAWPSAAPSNDVYRDPVTPQDSEQPEIYGTGYPAARPPSAPPPPSIPVSTNIVYNPGGLIFINNPYLFGGDEKEGGVSGFVDIHMGGPSQVQNAYLKVVIGPLIPAFRGVLTLVARQCYVASLNPYIKPWSIRATRCLAQSNDEVQWYASKAIINTWDMNPAHIIRECLTNRIYGKGRDAATEIDNVSFTAAADWLFAEGFGLSIIWGDTRDVDTFVQTILSHIDASLFQDRVTNKWKLKLARNDYDPNTVPIFNDDNIISIDELGRPLPSELVNQVTLTYWNQVNRKNDTIVLDNTALQDAIGGQINPNDVDRTGISRTELAQRVAARELRTLGTSLLTGRMTVNRDGLRVAMGDVFKLVLPRRNIVSVLCRVAAINFGAKDAEGIVISFIEDVFATPVSTYLGENPTMWEDPRGLPVLSPTRYFGEVPYLTLVQNLGVAEVNSLSPTSGALMLSGSRQTETTYSMHGWMAEGGGAFEDRGVFVAAASARVALAQVRAETSTVTVDQVTDPSQIIYGTYAAWGEELVMVLDYIFDTGIMILARGVLDTVPQVHGANSRILFIQNHALLDERASEAGETHQAKIVTVTGQGQLKLGEAPTDSYTMKSRFIRPYAPGQFRINGTLYPPTTYGIEPVLSWAHRNRIQQTAYIVQQGEGNIGPEPGVTYQIRTRDSNTNAVLATRTGYPTPNYTYSFLDDTTDGAVQDITFEIVAVRDGYTSWQSQAQAVSRHGFGFQYGSEYGGVAP